MSARSSLVMEMLCMFKLLVIQESRKRSECIKLLNLHGADHLYQSPSPTSARFSYLGGTKKTICESLHVRQHKSRCSKTFEKFIEKKKKESRLSNDV